MGGSARAARVSLFLCLAFSAGILFTSCVLQSGVGQLALMKSARRAWALPPATAKAPNPYVALCLSVKSELEGVLFAPCSISDHCLALTAVPLDRRTLFGLAEGPSQSACQPESISIQFGCTSAHWLNGCSRPPARPIR